MLVQCFYCKEKVAISHEALDHAYASHQDKAFSILVEQEEGRFLPKFYDWLPMDHKQVNHLLRYTLPYLICWEPRINI